jgi:hypothetical protein
MSLDAAIRISVIFVGAVVGFASTDAAGIGVELAFGDGVLGTGIGTPLFQTNFLPDLIAVYLLFCQSMTSPIFFGFSVGPWAAKTEEVKTEKSEANPVARIPRLLIELILKS